MTLTELSIKRPSLIVVIFSALAVIGLFSYRQLQYELLPKITPPVVTVTTVYPGASPSEVETSVTKAIEDAVSTLDKVEAVRAASQEGLSMVIVEFSQSANIDLALQEAQRRVGEARAKLPDEAKTPTLSKFALDEFPILRIGVTAQLPPKEFYPFLKDRVQPQISKVAGVGQITLIGGDEREIKVNLDSQRLRAYGLSLLAVTETIKNANLDFPTGKIKQADGQYIVRIAGKLGSLEELRSLVVGRSKLGGDIALRDVAEIQDGQREYTHISRVNGKTAVGLFVQKQSDANAVEVSRLARQAIQKIEAAHVDIGLKFDIAQDTSLFTLDAANAVKHDLFLAILLVAGVMLIFLHSLRNAVIVMIAIPTSLISTFIAMYAFGFTLNLMTLLGLSLVVGILVDDSIVVLENIYRHLESGADPRTAALRGRNEIGFAALSITLVDIAVFLPLAMVTGLVGNIMRQFSVVVVVSTLLSLVVSFTITPMLASRFARLESLNDTTRLARFGRRFEAVYHWITKEYIGLLQWSLANGWKIVLISLLLFVGALALVPLGFIGNEFITESDRGEFSVALELPPGAAIEQSNYVTQDVERILTAMPEVRKVFVDVGASNEGFIGQSSNNISELNVSLVPKEQRRRSTAEVGQEIKNRVRQIPGVKVRINPIGIFGMANQTPIQLVVTGTHRGDVQKAADRVAEVVRTIPGTADVRLSSEEGKPETRVEIDRQKMATFGLSLAEVGATLRVALSGDDDSKYRDGGDEHPIRVVLDEFDRSDQADLGNLSFLNRRGEPVELKQFAAIFQTTGPTKLQRTDRNESITVMSQAVGRPSGSIGQDIQAALAKEQLPARIEIAYEGDLKNQAESFISLGIALLAAILFVYMIMVALYDSYIYPFVVLFSVPVAIVGALLALALTMKSLSIFSILGMIMLVGLVSKNAILLVDRTNQKRAEGLTAHDALLEAGQTRLRPILMTTLAMVIGMLPIALGHGAGSEWKTGLAWALVGGLSSSMLLTLVLIPVIYLKIDTWRTALPALIKKAFKRDVIAKETPRPVVAEEWSDRIYRK